MPRNLKWKIGLVIAVLIFSGIANIQLCSAIISWVRGELSLGDIGPRIAQTQMWSGTVRDEVDKRGMVVGGGRSVLSKTVDKPLAYWMQKLTLGVFHHEKERYANEREIGRKGANRIVERDVRVLSAGLTLGLDLAGGAELRYRVIAQGMERETAAEKVIEIIRRRIDAMGLKEPIIQKEGATRIQIQLPGQDEQEIQRIQNIIETTGHLEFRLVSSNENLKRQAETGDMPEGYHLYVPRGGEEGSRLLVKDEPELTGQYIHGTGVQSNSETREIEVTLDFTGEGRRTFARVTESNIGERLAIILDDIRDPDGKISKQGMLYSAPTIQSAIFGSARITGNFTQEQAEDLRTTLQAGSLPATLQLEDKNMVGPSLGKDSVSAGMLASIVGFAATAIFMVMYYRKGGIVADIALLLNLVLVVGALAIFQATLTLPGIAGMLLSVAMSVDANVLIFERIREELEKKGTDRLAMALRDGYSRAFVTIVDSNLTTIGTALFLYLVGTGPVRGFATTLTLGIAFSMFTAIFVTRVIFDFFLAKNWMHRLSMARMIKKTPNIAFTSKTKYCLTASIICIAIGIGTFIYRGQDNYDIDFRGGTLLHVVTRSDVRDDEIRSIVSKDYPDASVQRVTSRTGHAEFEIKTSVLSEATVRSVETIPSVEVGEKERFAEGYELVVATDKPETEADVQQMALKVLPDAAVKGTGTPEGGRYREFTMMFKASDGARAKELAKSIFANLSVKAEMGRLLADKLVPDAFPTLALTPEGNVKAEVNFERSVAVDEMKQSLALWGYQDPAVSVKGDPAASEGKTLEVTVKAGSDDPEALRANIVEKFNVAEPFARVRTVSGHVAGEMKERAVVAIILSLVFVIGYVWMRFELNFGIAAVVALVHDVLFTIGMLAIFGVSFNLTVIAALLMLLGYSLNDTIVVFDRIRENLNLLRRERYNRLIDISVNQTLSRTLLTGTTTFFAIIALLIWGGQSIYGFSLALLIGMVVGTYSSIYIASPFVLMMHNRAERKRREVAGVPAAASKA